MITAALLAAQVYVWTRADSRLDPDLALFISCDVGQGDATLIQLGSFQMLVDAGQTSQVLDCLTRFMPKHDHKIEIVVATHADSDHIKGFDAVFIEYLVGEIWIVPLPKKTAEFEAFMLSVSRKIKQGSKVRYVNRGDVFTFGDFIKMVLLSPRVDQTVKKIDFEHFTETTLSDSFEQNTENSEWDNDRSIVIKLDIFDVSILLTGDIEKKTEQALLAAGLIDKIYLLKVAHHGSNTSTTVDFLNKAQPEIATVSSGQNNKYGHPSPEVLANLLERGTKILRTDQLSHIVFEISSNGEVKEQNAL